MGVLSAQRCGQPFVAADPADGFARAQIDDMRTAAKGVEARAGTGQTMLEPPEAGEVEVFGQA